MKKIFWVFFLSFVLLTFVPAITNAGGASGDWGGGASGSWEEETPAIPFCGPSGDPQATGIVPCGTSCQCTIENFFLMLARIFDFAIKFIAMPLAVLMLVIGGILIMISAGNPNMASLGKNTLYAAIIGLVLVFGAWLIIDFILGVLGYKGTWSVL